MDSPRLTMSVLYGLLALLWGGWIWWILTWWFTPLMWFMMDITMKVPSTIYFAGYESTWVVYNLALVAISIFAYLYLKVDRSKLPNRCLPLGKTPARWIRSLVYAHRRNGKLTVGELAWILATVALIVWYFIKSTQKNFTMIDHGHSWLAGKEFATHIWQLKFDLICDRFGWLSTMLLFPLFFPISRSSPLLRASGIPFEQASIYHRWIAHVMLWFALIHSVGYWVLWIQEGVLWKQASRWQTMDISNIPGEIDMLIGLVIWLTSLGPVRRKSFETFIWTHQAYILYLLFLYMHVGDFFVVIMFPPLVVYGMDRLFRSVQGLHLVKAKSATVHADGTIELVLPIASDFVYRSLDSIYINIPSISIVQWHPFTIASSPLDGQRCLKVIVKPLGWWTSKLQSLVAKEQQVLMRVEGPYGHPQDFFAKYDALVLVAGGIGITPFLSLLEDLLHRCEDEQQKLPSSVTVIWAVKSSSSVPLLQSLRANALCSQCESQLNLRVKIFVTQESSMEGIAVNEDEKPRSSIAWESSWPIMPQIGTGRELLSAAIFLFVNGGAFCIMLLFTYYVYMDIEEVWARGALLFMALIIGVLLPALVVIFLWYLARNVKESTVSTISDEMDDSEKAPKSKLETLSFLRDPEIIYGCRPNFEEIFKSLSQTILEKDVGVLTSGPEEMELDVARQCQKSHGFRMSLKSGPPVFSFHSLSFQL